MKVSITQLHSVRHLKFFLKMAEHISKNNVNVCFITNKRYIKEKINKSGYECGLLVSGSEEHEFTENNYDKKWLEICQKYRISENLDQFVHVEWIQNKYEYYSINELKSKCINKFHVMEKVYGELQYNFVIQPLASEIDRRIIHYVSKCKANSFYYHVSLLPGREFMFCRDEFGKPCLDLDIRVCKSLGINELKSIFLSARQNNKYLRKVEDRRGIFIAKLINIKHLNFILFIKATIHRLLSFKVHSLRKIYERFRKLSKLGYSSRELEDINYVFYTIHQPEEAQTLLRGYHNIDELELIKLICHNLPPGVKFVVKLHPRVEYCYTNKFIKNLVAIPNLLVAKSTENSIDLAQNSMGVLTISSSIWMECLLMNIPCFTFGRGAYDAFDDYPYQVNIDKVKDTIMLMKKGFKRNRDFDQKLVKKIYANSFSLERNALSQDMHRNLGDAIIRLSRIK